MIRSSAVTPALSVSSGLPASVTNQMPANRIAARNPATLVSECRLADIREMAASGAVGAGMLPKLAAIADALESGVEAVQVIDGRVPHSVLVEIFTEAGIGTKITA